MYITWVLASELAMWIQRKRDQLAYYEHVSKAPLMLNDIHWFKKNIWCHTDIFIMSNKHDNPHSAQQNVSNWKHLAHYESINTAGTNGNQAQRYKSENVVRNVFLFLLPVHSTNAKRQAFCRSHRAACGTAVFLTSHDIFFLTWQNKALADLLLAVVSCQENYQGREPYNMTSRVWQMRSRGERSLGTLKPSIQWKH